MALCICQEEDLISLLWGQEDLWITFCILSEGSLLGVPIVTRKFLAGAMPVCKLAENFVAVAAGLIVTCSLSV